MRQWSTFACLTFLFFFIHMGWPVTGLAEKARNGQLASKVGVIYQDIHNNLIMDIPQHNLRKGTRVVIVALPGQSLVCCATVDKVLATGPEATHQVIFDKDKSYSYSLTMDTEHKNVGFGLGILDSPSVFSAESGRVIADLDRDGLQETFRDCTSHEGVHVTIWSGPPLEGSKRWHAYFYLGYETVPSCVERDFE
ncbi:MAG: hypothetical protein ACE5K9_07425 [Candidatus Methylomirabilales bacterium]